MNSEFAALVSKSGFKQITIGQHTYMYEVLPAFPSLQVGSKLIKLLLPSISAAADAWEREKYIAPEESSFFSEISMRILDGLDKIDIVEVVQQLLFNVSCDGKKIQDVSKHFQGDVSTLLLILEDVVKENFGEYFLGYMEKKGLSIPSLEKILQRGRDDTSTPESVEQ